jgi:hypothetical protein
MTKQERAIETILEARQSHATWAEYLTKHPEAGASYHLEWCAKYDEVLEILRGAK